MRKLLLLTCISIFYTCSNQHRQPILSTRTLIDNMLQRYSDVWYSKLCFEQTTQFFKNDSLIREQTWFEVLQAPDKLLIKYDSLASGSGMLFRNDSLYQFENNKIIETKHIIHYLLLMCLGVYHQSVDITLGKLTSSGFDTAIFRQDVYKGKKAWVIGAHKGDTTSNQIWIDAENLLFLFSVKQTDAGMRRIEFRDYIEVGNHGFSPTTLLFFTNGTLTMKEKYHNIRNCENLKEEIFFPKTFSNSKW